MHKRTWTALNIALILCLALLAGCKKGESEEKPEVAVQAAPARQGDIARMVNAEAVVFPLQQSVITTKINAPIRKFYVVRGQKVSQGQLLAELENRDLQAAATDNRGAYDQAQAQYQTSIGATLPEEIQKTELDVQTSQQGLDAQQKLYSSRQDLYNQGALPRKDLDAAAVSLAQAKSAYNIAKKHLDSLNAIGRHETLRAANGQLASAKAKLAGSEAQLGYSEVRSPISGVITDRPLYPGEMASSAAPLLTVMDISQIIAKAHIPQSDAALIKKGDKATLSITGLDTKLNGTVTLVSPALDPNSTTLEIWVQAANPEQQLRPGMTTQVAIIAQTVHDAVVVPSAALLNANGSEAQVMVIDSQSVAQSRDVKLGIQGGQEAQIVAGLKPGEMVINEGAYGLPDKTKVKVEKPDTDEKKPEAAQKKPATKADD